MWRKCILLFCILGYTVSGADSRHSHQTRSVRPRRDFPRAGRQVDGNGIDFSNAVFDEQTGKRCVIKEESVQSLEKSPILECVHKESEQCHYTYITKFTPSQEEVCEENFEKQCQITFKQQAINETVQKCYKPIVKVCNGDGEEICQTVYESSCSTKYIEKQPGKFVGDTNCEKLPVQVCGAGCTFQEGPQECHDKVLVSLLDVPEEVCDLNPQKTCRLQTKLVPKLTPEHQCTRVPREICTLRFTTPQQITKPLLTKWCLDDSPVVRGELYDESNALASPLPLEVERTIQDVGRFVQRNRLSFDLNTEKTFQDLGQSISSQRAFEKLGQNVQSLKIQDSGDIQYLNEISDPTLKAEPQLILHKTEIISRESEQLVREPHQIINQETFQLLEPEIRDLPEELTPELEFDELDPELRNPGVNPLETENLKPELRTQEIELINQADELITEQPELITENPEQIELISDNEKLLTLGMQENNRNPEEQVSTNPENQVSQNPEQIKQDELLQHKMDLILEAEELNRELKALRLEALAMDKSELKNLDLDIDLEKSLLNQDTSFFNPDTDKLNPDTDLLNLGTVLLNPDTNLLKEDELNSSSLSILSSSDDEDFLTNFKTQEFADFVDFSHL